MVTNRNLKYTDSSSNLYAIMMVPKFLIILNEIMCVIVYLTIIRKTIYNEFQQQLFGSALVATELFRYVSPTNLYSV